MRICTFLKLAVVAGCLAFVSSASATGGTGWLYRVTIYDNTLDKVKQKFNRNMDRIEALPLDQAPQFRDVTTGNASTNKHGFLPKLTNTTSLFLNGKGLWSSPAGGSGVDSNYFRYAGNLTGLTAVALSDWGLPTNTMDFNAQSLYGIGSLVIGTGTATGQYAFAQGAVTAAGGIYSSAEGSGSSADGDAAHAEGYNSVASGSGSHAEGGGTYATNSYTHAEGYQSRAYGYTAHAAGLGARATDDYSWVWSSYSPYYSHGAGSFNIGEAAGIWDKDYLIASNGYLFVREAAVVTNPVAASIVGADTSRWNQAVADGSNWITSVARGVVAADTSRWNQASADGSNWILSVARGIVSADTDRWNQVSGVSTGLVNIGTATAPTCSLSSASMISLGKADSAIQTELDPVWAGVSNRYAFVTTNYTTGFAIDGIDTLINTNSKGFIRVPTTGTITQWVVRAQAAGTVVFKLEKGTASAFPTVSSIVASAPPKLTAQSCATSSVLTGWTCGVTAGDYLKYTILTNTVATNLAIELTITIP